MGVNPIGFILHHLFVYLPRLAMLLVPGNGEVEMDVKLKVKMEVEMEIKMDAPILPSTYTWALCAPV